MDHDESFLELGPIRHALSLSGIQTPEDLAQRTAFEILRTHGAAKRHLPIIEAFLARRGLSLKPASDPREHDDAERNWGRRYSDTPRKKRPGRPTKF